MISAGPQSATAFLRACAIFVLVVIGAMSVHAAFELRPLYADASHYLVTILRLEDYMLAAPARRAVEWIRQTPTLAAINIGVSGLSALTLILSLSFALVPLVLTAACWAVLPRDKKWFFVFPLLHFCAGTLAGIFSSQQEGATAAAAFWFLFYFILFRATRTRAIDVAILLSLPAVVLHEGMIFLAPVLAATAYLRARGLPARTDRVALRLLAAWFAIVVAGQIYFIAYPRHVGFGAGYQRDLLSGAWLIDGTGAVNLSAGLGVAGLVLLGFLALVALVRGRAAARGGWYLVAAFVVAAIAAFAYLAMTDRMLDMMPQFRARNHGLLVSFPLALAALATYYRTAIAHAAVLRQSAAACAVMAAASAAWQVNATMAWSRALADFRSLLAESRGFREWDVAVEQLPPQRRAAVRLMIHDWIVSPLSIVLSPNGQVVGVLGTAAPRGFRPFDPLDPEKVPRSRFWDIAPYLAAIRDRAAAPAER